MKKPKLRLTKKRLNALHVACSIDDVLFARYNQLMANVEREAKRIIHNRKRIVQVRQKDRNGNWRLLQIQEVYVTSDGMVVEVKNG